jgi:glyoxylate reductase
MHSLMSSKSLKVVVTRRLPDPVETRLRELFDAELNVDDAPMNAEALVAAAQRADVLVPTVTDRIDSRKRSPASTTSTCRRRWSAGSPSPIRPACLPRTPPT